MKIRDQLARLAAPIAALIVAFLVARSRFVPHTFGEIGHYRAAAVAEVAAIEPVYAGHETCAECHDEIVSLKERGYHRDVSCEVCHGAAKDHAEDPGARSPPAPRTRDYCPLCHSYMPARPLGFPQIVPETHNPPKPCMKCHNPHDPKPPRVPEECGACHGRIARMKGISHHAELECTFCHVVDDNHKVEPRTYRPTKPMEREFCGRCHSEGTTASDVPQSDMSELAERAPKVSLSAHYPEFLCWQCHYPHQPEAR